MKSLWLLLFALCTFAVRAQVTETAMQKGIAAFNKKNYVAAIKYFDAEARKRNPEGFYYMALCYDKGLGITKNPNEALTLYEMAAQSEPYCLPAIAALINIYATGRIGGGKQPNLSFMWAKSLVDLDSAKKYPDACYQLAEMYWKGIGTGKSLEKATALMWKGKFRGSKLCVDGCKTLGSELYRLGLDASDKKDFKAAARYYRMGADVYDTDAMIALGDLYSEGLGTNYKSMASRNDLYDQAARYGNAKAMAIRRTEVTDEHLVFMLKARLRQPDGSFIPLPYHYSGKGFARWENGETYEGDFSAGRMFGTGKRYYSNGKLWCEGSLENGVLSYGEVVYCDTDGNVYKGTMIDGKQKGYGELVSRAGVYQGDWDKGKQNGTGRLKTADGTTFWGTYVDGKLEGEGTVIFSDGRNAKGKFFNGEMTGRWDYYNYLTGFIEVRNYTSTGVYTMFKKTDDRSDLAKASRDYAEWWQKTYGRGGTQNNSMQNYNKPQAGYSSGKQSEADRHQKAMDQIYRDTEKQMNRSFKY